MVSNRIDQSVADAFKLPQLQQTLTGSPVFYAPTTAQATRVRNLRNQPPVYVRAIGERPISVAAPPAESVVDMQNAKTTTRIGGMGGRRLHMETLTPPAQSGVTRPSVYAQQESALGVFGWDLKLGQKIFWTNARMRRHKRARISNPTQLIMPR